MAPTIVTRPQWGARTPRGVVSTTSWSRRVGVAIHHSAGPTSQTVRQIQNFQMDSNGWQDIGYNWLVTQDGRLWEGRLHTWTAIGAHAGGQNTGWIGVCWIGTSGSTAPSAAALTTIRWVVDEARRRAGRRLDVRGHGQVPGQATECPGSRLRAWIAAGLPVASDEEDDMGMELTDGVDMTNPAGGRWSFGRILGKDSITVKAALGYAAAGGWQLQHDVVPLLPKLLAGQAALIAAHQGEDVGEAIRAELDRHRDLLVAQLEGSLAPALLAELGPALAESLGEAAGELPADVVEAAVARALARTSLTVEPAAEESV